MEDQEFRNIEEALAHLRSLDKRKFSQSLDMNFTIKGIDLKRPENKFSKEIVLPHGSGKAMEVCVMSDALGLGKAEIEEMGRDAKSLKKFSKKYDYFLCEAPLMPIVGKVLGRYLAPKGKMPKLLPPGKDPASMIDEAKRTVRIRLRDSPSIQVIIGTEAMSDQQLRENGEKIIEEVKKSLPGKAQIKKIYLKFTMSKPVKLKV